MKIISKGISPAGNEVLELHLGIDEAKLIFGLVKKAVLVYPLGEGWKPDGRRLNNINRCFKRYFEPTKQPNGEGKSEVTDKEEDGNN